MAKVMLAGITASPTIYSLSCFPTRLFPFQYQQYQAFSGSLPQTIVPPKLLNNSSIQDAPPAIGVLEIPRPIVDITIRVPAVSPLEVDSALRRTIVERSTCDCVWSNTSLNPSDKRSQDILVRVQARQALAVVANSAGARSAATVAHA